MKVLLSCVKKKITMVNNIEEKVGVIIALEKWVLDVELDIDIFSHDFGIRMRKKSCQVFRRVGDTPKTLLL